MTQINPQIPPALCDQGASLLSQAKPVFRQPSANIPSHAEPW
jgi:hypothetical protein